MCCILPSIECYCWLGASNVQDLNLTNHSTLTFLRFSLAPLTFLIKLIKLPNYLQRRIVPKGQRKEPESEIDACRYNQHGQDSLYPKSHSNTGCLNSTKQRTVPDLITRRVREVADAPVDVIFDKIKTDALKNVNTKSTTE